MVDSKRLVESSVWAAKVIRPRGDILNNYQTTYTNLMIQEIKAMPDEYLPALLNMMRLFRESITLKPAEHSFQQGWQEAMTEETLPIEELWVGIDAG